MKVMPEDEGIGAANYSGGLQFVSDAPGGEAGPQQDNLLSLRRNRQQQGPGKPSARHENGEQNECEECTQVVQ